MEYKNGDCASLNCKDCNKGDSSLEKQATSEIVSADGVVTQLKTENLTGFKSEEDMEEQGRFIGSFNEVCKHCLSSFRRTGRPQYCVCSDRYDEDRDNELSMG